MRQLMLHPRQSSTHVCGSHRGQFCISIVGGRDLDNVRRDDMQTIQSAKDGSKLAGRPASSLWRTRGGGEGGVDRIDLRQLC